MRIITSVSSMQRLGRQWRRASAQVGFVPTMGYLHAGHLSLVQRARRAVGRDGIVVVSVYVNPTQFGPREDLSLYPRDLKRDTKLCREAGVDLLFVPSDDEMYPAVSTGDTAEWNAFSTFVVEECLSQGMEGASRPGHFRGVTTVVAKLFNLVLPDVAIFGAKDYQQAAVVRRMVRDLNFPVRVIVAPIFREVDGLAMSSRNKYLSPVQRSQASVLWRALQRARSAVRSNPSGVPSRRLKLQLRKLIEAEPQARLDYIEFFEPESLRIVPRVTRGTQMALAAFVGKTRLIDNTALL